MKKRSWGLILSYTNTLLSMVCGLFLSSFLLRKLGDTEYGIYQTMASFANYLVLLEFGAGTIMSRNIVACRTKINSDLETEKNISTIWTITNILSVVIVFVSVIFYFLLDIIYGKSMSIEEISHGKQMFIFIVIFLVVSFYSQTLNGVALAFEDYTFSSKNNIIKLLTRTVLIVSIILNFKNAIVIVIVDAAVGLLIALYSYFYCIRKYRVRINFRNFDKGILRTSMPLCIAIFLQGVINQANSNVGKFILGIKIGPEEVALYSVALYIYGVFSSVSTIPVSLYVPQVTKDVVRGLQGKELTKTLVQPSRLIAIVGGTIVGGFIAAGKPFISIVYGAEYSLAWYLAIIIMVPMFVYSTTAICLNVLDAKNKRIGCSVLLMITTAFNVLLTLILSEKFNIIGVAVATGISTLIGQVVLLGLYYHRTVKISVLYLLFNSYKGILIYQLVAAVLGYIISVVVQNQYLAFALAGITYVVVSFGGFLLLGKNETENKMICQIVNKVKSKEKL